MNTNNILLSICIPTYNREKYLERLLESIVTQSGWSDRVEICIDDGPSTDNTQSLVERYQKQYSNIRYFRNDVAIGMMPAILESISFSQGTYTWLFGSDDAMAPDALEKTLTIIKKFSPTLVLSDRKVFISEDQVQSTSLVPELQYSLFHGFEDFSGYLGNMEDGVVGEKANYFTYMSIFCFQTDYYRESLRIAQEDGTFEKMHLLSHYFNYIVILYSRFPPEDIIALIKNNIVYTQDDNCSWKGNTRIIDDLASLFGMVKERYTLDPKSYIFFRKVLYGWSIAIRGLQGILNTRLMRFLKRNSYTRGFYQFSSRIFAYFLNLFS